VQRRVLVREVSDMALSRLPGPPRRLEIALTWAALPADRPDKATVVVEEPGAGAAP
jgi:hypothetical protein